MRKKIVSILTVSAITLSMMAGCGSSNNSTSNNTAGDTESAATQAEQSDQGQAGSNAKDEDMADKKVGVNSKMSKRQSNGAIDMTDDAFIREWNYNLVFNRTVSDNVYEFTVQRMVGKQLKSGKLQIRRNGDKITMTGMDAWTKQQPFHGKTIGKPNPTYN